MVKKSFEHLHKLPDGKIYSFKVIFADKKEDLDIFDFTYNHEETKDWLHFYLFDFVSVIIKNEYYTFTNKSILKMFRINAQRIVNNINEEIKEENKEKKIMKELEKFK